jgi:hypothetical protein
VHSSSEMKMQNPQISRTIGIANTNRRSSQDVLATRRANAEIALHRAFNCRPLVKSVWTSRRSDRRYSRPGHSVSVVGGLVTGAINCRGAVPAQTVGVVPATPGSASQAHDATWLSLVLWSRLFNSRAGIDDRQPETLVGWHRQGFKAVEVAVGTTATSGKCSPADCPPGAGEPTLGRGAHRSRTSGEARSARTIHRGAWPLENHVLSELPKWIRRRVCSGQTSSR